MIVGGNSIRGLYKYSKEIEYEKDDFVVFGKSIYVCTRNFKSNDDGVNPSNQPEYFEVYLAEKIATLEDFLKYADYIENEEEYDIVPEDKLINCYTLYQILERVCFGVDTEGLISGSVIYNNVDENICYSIGSIKEIFTWDTSDNLKDVKVLDSILNGKNLNNGIVRVDKNLPEIKNLVFNPGSNSDSSKLKFLILKQYSYIDNGNKCRIQELINPNTGYTYYRFCEGTLEDDNWVFKNPSIWKRSFIDDSNIAEELTAIDNYVNNRKNEETKS